MGAGALVLVLVADFVVGAGLRGLSFGPDPAILYARGTALRRKPRRLRGHAAARQSCEAWPLMNPFIHIIQAWRRRWWRPDRQACRLRGLRPMVVVTGARRHRPRAGAPLRRGRHDLLLVARRPEPLEQAAAAHPRRVQGRGRRAVARCHRAGCDCRHRGRAGRSTAPMPTCWSTAPAWGLQGRSSTSRRRRLCSSSISTCAR